MSDLFIRILVFSLVFMSGFVGFYVGTKLSEAEIGRPKDLDLIPKSK